MISAHGIEAATGGSESEGMVEDYETAVLVGSLLIDAAELAVRLGYNGQRGARTVREKAAAGEIPFVRLGRDLRFHWPTVIRSLGVLLHVAAGEPRQTSKTRE